MGGLSERRAALLEQRVCVRTWNFMLIETLIPKLPLVDGKIPDEVFTVST